MIKLAALAVLPVLAATFYAQPDTMPEAKVVAASGEVEHQDREFLETLKTQYNSVEKIERSDREFLERLQVEEMPVRRAIAVERPAPIATAPAVPAVAIATASEMPEVRRAIPVSAPRTDLRAKLNQAYVTMGESAAPAPEIRRATPVTHGRASIVIFGDQVTITPRATTVAESGTRRF